MQPARRLGSWPSGKPAASGRRPVARAIRAAVLRDVRDALDVAIARLESPR